MITTARFVSYFLLLLCMVSCRKVGNAVKETIIEYKVLKDASISDISFVNKNIGFFSGSYETEKGAAVVGKTVDGGKTWEIIPVYINNSPASVMRSIYAKDANTIYATYNAINDSFGVCISKNGGHTWDPLGHFTILVAYTGVYFQDSLTGFVCGTGILKTEDGGRTWRRVYATNNFLQIGRLVFTSKLIGYAYGGFTDDGGSSGIMVKTTDGGNTWTPLPFSELVTSLNFISDETGYAFTFDDHIYKTTDGGANWNLLNDTIGGLYFSSVINGEPKYFASGWWIYRSTDDFKSFQKIYTSSDPRAEFSIKAVRPSTDVIYFASRHSVFKIIIHK